MGLTNGVAPRKALVTVDVVESNAIPVLSTVSKLSSLRAGLDSDLAPSR